MKKRILSLLLSLALCLSLAGIALAANEREPNSSAETATAIGVNETINGAFAHSGNNGDTDWYTFTISSSGGVTFSFETAAKSSFSATVYYIDGSGELTMFYAEDFAGLSNPVGPTASHSSYTLYMAAGTYYLRLYASRYNDGEYSFQVGFTSRSSGTLEYEPNASSQTASSINVNQTVAGSFIHRGNNGDTDWYRFTTTSPGAVNFAFEMPAGIDFTAYLYCVDESGDLDMFYSGDFDGLSNPVTTTTTHTPYTLYLDAGTYYLNLYASKYNDGNYSFHVGFTPRSDGTLEYEPNASSQTASPISLNQAVASSFIHRGNNGDTDWYRLTLPRAGSLSLSLQTPASMAFTVNIYSVDGQGDLDSVYYESVSSVSNSAQTTKTTVTDYLYLAAGTYYVRLYASKYNDGEYSFRAYTDSVSMPSAWAQEQVAAAISAGLVPENLQSGYTSPVTRGDVVEVFIRLIESCAGKSIEAVMADEGVSIDYGAFTDTRDEAVLAAHALGIINGVGNGRFDPDGTLTRSQIAAILNRIARLMGVRTSGYSHSFTDVSGHWVNSELGWPVHAGIIQGVGNNRFDPDGDLTTEQAIVIAYRALEALT